MKKILDNFPSQSKNIIYTYSTLCRIIDVNKTNHHTFLSNGKLLAFVSGEGIRIIIDFHLNPIENAKRLTLSNEDIRLEFSPKIFDSLILIKDKSNISKEFHIIAYDIRDLELNKPTHTLVVNSTTNLFYRWNPNYKEYILIITSSKILIWDKDINKIICSNNLKENITDANWHYGGQYITTLNGNNEIKIIYFDKFEKNLTVLVTIEEKDHNKLII